MHSWIGLNEDWAVIATHTQSPEAQRLRQLSDSHTLKKKKHTCPLLSAHAFMCKYTLAVTHTRGKYTHSHMPSLTVCFYFCYNKRLDGHTNIYVQINLHMRLSGFRFGQQWSLCSSQPCITTLHRETDREGGDRGGKGRKKGRWMKWQSVLKYSEVEAVHIFF